MTAQKMSSERKVVGNTEDWNKNSDGQMDTGAECSVLSKREAKRLALDIKKSSTKRIVTYNNTSIPVIGESKVKCESQNKSSVVTFKIVGKDLTPILERTMLM